MKPRYVFFTALYCAGIFWLSSLPEMPSPPLPSFLEFLPKDKVAHAVLYAGLAALVSLGIRRADRPAPGFVQFFVPIAFALVYGLSDEIHQLYVPQRTFEVADLAADTAGAAAMQLLLWLCYRKKDPKQHPQQVMAPR